MKFPIEPFHAMGPGGAFYDIIDIMPKVGLDYENENDLFYEMSGPWGPAHRFNIYQFKHPTIPTNIPERFDFYSYAEVMQYPLVMPTIAGMANFGEVVSLSFIEKMRELGFHDFVTYPVRVHLLNTEADFNGQLELIEGRFPYRDDLFVMLQLTAPHFPLLEPIPADEPVDPKRYRMDDYNYLREDFEDIKCPLFFRMENAFFDLRCNEAAAQMLSAPEFLGIRLIGGQRKKTF
jgi:hypothetical protein